MDKLVENIDRYCERNEISIRRFEIQCRLPNGVVAKWRNGICSPSLKSLMRIADRTQIPIKKWIG